MDTNTAYRLEQLFLKKIVSYQNLIECLRDEREALIQIDLDRLWEISGDKEVLLDRIGSLREEIIATLRQGTGLQYSELSGIPALVPLELREKFRRLYRTLATLRKEIEVLRKQNMAFINDSLHFLDHMISIIMGESETKITYNHRRELTKPCSPVLMYKEA